MEHRVTFQHMCACNDQISVIGIFAISSIYYFVCVLEVFKILLAIMR